MPKKKSFVITSIALGALLLIFISLEIAGHLIAFQSSSQGKSISVEKNPGQVGGRATSLKNHDLRSRIANLSPRELYIVIDTANNILYLKDLRYSKRRIFCQIQNKGPVLDKTRLGFYRRRKGRSKGCQGQG